MSDSTCRSSRSVQQLLCVFNVFDRRLPATVIAGGFLLLPEPFEKQLKTLCPKDTATFSCSDKLCRLYRTHQALSRPSSYPAELSNQFRRCSYLAFTARHDPLWFTLLCQMVCQKLCYLWLFGAFEIKSVGFLGQCLDSGSLRRWSLRWYELDQDLNLLCSNLGIIFADRPPHHRNRMDRHCKILRVWGSLTDLSEADPDQ